MPVSSAASCSIDTCSPMQSMSDSGRIFIETRPKLSRSG